jgi:hypothetical protein
MKKGVWGRGGVHNFSLEAIGKPNLRLVIESYDIFEGFWFLLED